MTAFNYKWKYEKLAVVVRVPQTLSPRELGHCTLLSFAEDDLAMYTADLQRTFKASVLLGSVLVASLVRRGELSKPRQRRQGEHHQTKGTMSN